MEATQFIEEGKYKSLEQVKNLSISKYVQVSQRLKENNELGKHALLLALRIGQKNHIESARRLLEDEQLKGTLSAAQISQRDYIVESLAFRPL